MFLKQTAYKPRSMSQSSDISSSSPTDTENTITATPSSPDTESTITATPTSPTWQDRRFMWRKGREAGGRKASLPSGSETVAEPSPFSFAKPNTSENPHPASVIKSPSSPVTTMPSVPLRDRHVIWSKGKEVHESAAERRKSSASSASAKSGILANLLGK